jgi:1-acyl-sn-glycerol-3-phosphate acyltransferase
MDVNELPEDSWWRYEPPPTAYDLVGNNVITRALRPFLYVFVKLYFRYRHRLHIVGYKPYYADQSYLIIANHSSHLDTPLIFSCFPYQRVNDIRAVAALDYFFSNPFLRGFAHLLCNVIPISRKAADFISLSMCNRTLKTGGTIILYPEGTRTRTGRPGEFKPGIGMLIKVLKTPLLPVYIEGTYDCYNYQRVFPSAGSIQVRFGSPIVFDPAFLAAMDYREITSHIQNLFTEMVKALRTKDVK